MMRISQNLPRTAMAKTEERVRMARVPPVRFFLVTFLLSWSIWIPLTLSHFGIGPFHIPETTSNGVRLLGVLMPAVAACILTAQTGGRSALRALFSRLVLWRVDWKWWFAAAAGQPILLGLTAITFNAIFRSIKIIPEPVSTATFVVNAIMLLIATLGEEIGWRGVALPTLQQQHSPFISSAILGLLWATWHVPFWLLLDSFDQFGIAYLLLNFLFVLPLTLYITWFFNRGEQSILLPVVAHVTFNIVNTVLLQVTINIGAFVILIALEWLTSILIIPQLRPHHPNSKEN